MFCSSVYAITDDSDSGSSILRVKSGPGHTIIIFNGDSSPSLADFTDFGQKELNSFSTHTYLVENKTSSSITLNLGLAGLSPSVRLNDSVIRAALQHFNPIATAWAVELSDFQLSTTTLTLAANASETFSVTFNPKTLGQGFADVELSELSGGDGIIFHYAFSIAGTGISANQPPLANDANPTTTTIAEDSGNLMIQSSSLLSKYIDPDGDSASLSIASVSAVTGGSVTLSPDKQNITFTPALNFSGQAKFTYTVSDVNGGSAVGQVIITVNPVDDAPTVSNPPAPVTVNEDAANSSIDLSNVFTDIEGDTIALSIAANTNPSLVTPSLLNGTNLILAYAPNQSGSATLTIRATANGKTVDTTLTVTVNPVDDSPTVSNPPAAVTVNEDAANSSVDLSNIFTDAEGDPITLSIVSNSNTGLVTPTLAGKTLTLAYTPNQSGTATIVIRATANGKTVDVNLTVTVNSSDDAPMVSNPPVAVTVNEDAANSNLDLSKSFTDAEGDPITLSIVSNSNTGLVTPTLAGKTLTLAYTSNQSGTATIVIRATANGKTVDTSVQVTVKARHGFQVSANSQAIPNGDTTPSASDCTDFGPIKVSGESKACTYTINNLDPEAITVVITQADVASRSSLLSWPTLTRLLNSLNPITSVWAVGFGDFTASASSLTIPANGTANFSITFDPSAAGLRESLVSLSISGRLAYSFRTAGTGVTNNSPPVVTQAITPVVVNENAPRTVVNLNSVFTDPDNQAITLSIVGNTNSNLVTPTLNGNTLTLAYAPNQSGSATITIRATAADGETVETWFTVTVNSSTAIPIFSPFGLLALLVSLVWLGRRYKL
ncbi:MAG: tandem-95 repeat protein [Thiolinea sp.]